MHAERRASYDQRQVAWDWLSTQFEDGSELSLYSEVYVNVPKQAGMWAVLIDPPPAVLGPLRRTGLDALFLERHDGEDEAHPLAAPLPDR